jgi:hypothetical protein
VKREAKLVQGRRPWGSRIMVFRNLE